MLAEIRRVQLSESISIPTPLLIPSFSSKYRSDINGIIHGLSAEFNGTPILISAYDLHYDLIDTNGLHPDLLVLDSGGYEAGQDNDGLELGVRPALPWSPELHLEVIARWIARPGCIVVTYDHPTLRRPLEEQIASATELSEKFAGAIEFLVKPEHEDGYLDIDKAIEHIYELVHFNVIGVTEKELGKSLAERITNVARLRRAISAVSYDTPIHVLGSLDTVTTPMFFLAGADVFDGLGWLRFAFHEGSTMYKQQFAACTLKLSDEDDLVDACCWVQNRRYLVRLQNEMNNFLRDHDLNCFSYHRNLLRRVINDLLGG